MSVKGIIDMGKDFMDASNTAATAQARLSQAMGNVKGTTQAQINAISAYSDVLEKNTTISHIGQETAASQLATYQLHSDTIKKLLPALDDLAAGQYGAHVSNEQMQQSANILGKVMAGNVTSLKRMGVALSVSQLAILKNGTEAQKAATLMDVLKGKYGGMAAAVAATPEGRIEQLNQAWEHVKETVGDKLKPVITSALGLIADNLPAIQANIMAVVNAIGPAFDYFKNNILPAIGTGFKIAGGFAGWFGDHIKVIAPIVLGIAGAFATYKAITLVSTAVTQGMAIAQGVLNAVMSANPIALVVIGVAALIAAGVALYENWSTISAGAKKLWADIQPVFSAIGGFIIGIFEGVWNGIKMYINFWIGALNTLIKGIDSVSSVIGKAVHVNLTIPQIPGLAEGGIVPARPGGGLFNLGEGGRDEAVIPLPKGGGLGGIGGGPVTNNYFQPVYNLAGASAQDIKNAGQDAQQEWERRMEAWKKHQARISFATP